MRKFLIAFLIVLISLLVFPEVRSIKIVTDQKTSTPVPFKMSMWNLLELIGEDFDANWNSLRVFGADGRELPYQIDDVDLNGKLSSNDVLVFLFKGEAKIVVSDDVDVEKPDYKPAFEIEEEKGRKYVKCTEIPFKVEVDDHGLTHVVGFYDLKGNIYRELGIARVAGWVGSTYYVDGKLGRHDETVSYGFKPVEVKILNPGPVCTTVVAKLRSERFPGLYQNIVSHILKTGEVLVNSEFIFKNYADMMKVQIMATHPLTDLDSNALHVLPVFRRLVWAEQLNISPMEYWAQRNALKFIDGKPYIVFPATDSMKPLWWGATYIFASMEDWRANYSEEFKVFVGEVLDKHPVVYSDFKKFVFGNTWVYESREFRDGIFRWIPGEFEAYEATKGAISTKLEDWVAHFKAGDVVSFTRLFVVGKGSSLKDVVEYLEGRAHEFQSVSVSK